MFVAMNRFRIRKGEEAAFEAVWRARDSRLAELPGFRAFHLLKGPERDDHRLYATHTIWESEEHFLDWTRSEQFRDAHKDAGQTRGLYLGHPEFEGFESVLEETADKSA